MLSFGGTRLNLLSKPMKYPLLIGVLAASCLVLAQVPLYNPTPTRAFGQTRLTPVASGNPNLVEGREFYIPQSIAFDTSTNPARVYVADLINNRVLAWRSASAITKGNPADLVIGQTDKFSTKAGGPSTAQTTGLNGPVAIAVDGTGNVYIADAGNNRIMRFPKPFAQTGDLIVPDLVIGQRTFQSGNLANEGAGVPSAKTLALMSGGHAYTAAMVFDKQGNLWVSDPVNNRVLRFPISALVTGTVEPSADYVLGQTTFDSAAIPQGANRFTKTTLVNPSGLAFADNGDLYISDAFSRVLYFKAPLSAPGQPALRILGIPTPTAADPNPRGLNGCPSTPPQPCEYTLGAAQPNNTIAPPQGLAVLADSLYVADSGNNRLVKYDPPSNWQTECIPTTTACPTGQVISPPGSQFIGQIGGQAIKANQGGFPSASTLSQPVGIAFLGTDMWVVDAYNNRVTVWPQSGGLYTAANKVLGQTDFAFNAPNLIEGRELFIFDPASGQAAAGLAVDTTSDPPHLYVADTLNNRILGFRNARKVKPGDSADLVIGQPDLFSSSPNYVTHDVFAPTEATLNAPVGLLISPTGDLFAADSGNSRVLRFPRPFDQNDGFHANLVIGQQNFFTRIIDPSSSTMRSPWGLAFSTAGHLLVSDSVLNRVLLFKKQPGADFTSGQRADSVIGQSDFFGFSSGTAANRFNSPRGIAVDSSDRLYVADGANNRISVFSNVAGGAVDPSARFSPSIGSPFAVAVNSRGEIWVTDARGGRMLRFPIFDDWFASVTPSNPGGSFVSQLVATQTADPNFPTFPIAITLDTNDNPIVAESINRVSFYFIQAAFSNAASYVTRGLTPGMLAYLARVGPPFAADGTLLNAAPPLPTTLGDIQVLLNGSPVPVYQVLPSRVTFQVPWSTSTTGNADIQLIRASTGEVLAAATFPLHTADPALFTANAQGFGLLAVTNQDGTVNTPSNAAPRGSVISIYGTGIGPVPNAPPDGQVASSPTPDSLWRNVLRLSTNPGGGVVPDANILYFGLVNWFPGVFQINFKIPDSIPPSPTVDLGIFWQDYLSTDGPNGRVTTTIAVK
jgi:uncharacterized protein (TIGR03437 family)